MKQPRKHPALPLIQGRSILCFDLETTGLNPERDKIIEIGWCLLTELGEVEEPQSVLVNPGTPIKNAHIHGITDAMIEGAPHFFDAVGEMPYHAIMSAYNSKFDLSFLVTHGWNANDRWVVDAAEIVKAHFGYEPGYRLGLAQALKKLKLKEPEGAHRAARDAQVLATVLQRVLYG